MFFNDICMFNTLKVHILRDLVVFSKGIQVLDDVQMDDLRDIYSTFSFVVRQLLKVSETLRCG